MLKFQEKKMSSAKISSLWRALHEAFHNYLDTKEEAHEDSKKTEKEMLITLTKVCKGFRNLADHHHHLPKAISSEDVKINFDSVGKEQYSSDHSSIKSITETLAFLLVIDSDFISHSSAKALLAISGYLEEGSNWSSYLQFLWKALKTICLSSEMHYFCGALDLLNLYDWQVFSSIPVERQMLLFAKHRVIETRCSTSSGHPMCQKKIFLSASRLLQLLRNILKTCHLEMKHTSEIFFHIANSHVIDVSLILLEKLQVTDCVITKAHHEICSKELELLLGSLLQYLSSFVHIINSNTDTVGGGCNTYQRSTMAKLIDCIPVLAMTCLGRHKIRDDACMLRYLRHKFLMLMIRISDCPIKQASTFHLWLNLLWRHAEDLFCDTCREGLHDVNVCLASSALSASSDQWSSEVKMSNRSLQSYAIFLILKWSFSLFKIHTENYKRIYCSSTLVTDHEESNQELYSCISIDQNVWEVLILWLEKQISCVSDVTSSSQKVCESFVSSFLQILMEEDDIMFKVLLQFVDYPVVLEYLQANKHQLFKNKEFLEVWSGILASLMPSSLFFEFLRKIQYDHSVLVDYLISKDTGLLCLTYLMRCLKILCDSKPKYIKRKNNVGITDQFACEIKKHKSSPQSNDSNASLPIMQNRYKMKETTGSLYKEKIYGHETIINSCLSSLHDSIERLHQKDLFPYNPSPLLKRLKCFLQILL